MPSVVLDSNVWVSAILKPEGHYARFIKALALKTQIVAADEILAEVREVCLRPVNRRKYQLTEPIVDRAVAQIRHFVLVFSKLPNIKVVKADPDDDMVIACAIKAQANFIITYDPHLLKLKQYQEIKIVTPREFSTRHL